jgi:hypothetical protein
MWKAHGYAILVFVGKVSLLHQVISFIEDVALI